MSQRTPASRRLPLTRERVLQAAVMLADAHGVEAVSMRRLGQELRVEAMSLYNHVAGKGDLLAGMADIVVGEIGCAEETDVWQATMRAQLLAARTALVRHRWAPRVIEEQKEMSPAMLAYTNHVVGILLRGGFSPALAHHAMHALGSRILGFTQELFDDGDDAAPGGEEAAAIAEQMARAYPNLGRMLEATTHDDDSSLGRGCDDQFEFEFALDLILDGLERLRGAEAGPG